MKRVLVIFDEPILKAGVESLLSREVDLEILSTTLVNGDQLCDQLNSYCPEVVILDEKLESARISNVIDLLNRYPSIRVLVVNLRDNRLHIYEKHEIMVAHSTDLVSTIRGS